MLWILKIVAHALFRIIFTLEYIGVENVPATGPVIIAGNHPSYLDPLLVSLPIRRKIRFIAWDKLFKVPVLGAVIRFLGAFPVDITRRDSRAFEQCIEVLNAGNALGIFPEAGRSRQPGLNEVVKTGAARFAIQTAAPLVPVTITGAHDAWPASRLIPLPRKITVKYHPAIRLDPAQLEARRDDPEYAREITELWRDKVEQRLLPSLKVTDKLYHLFARPAWPLRVYEIVPVAVALTALFSAVPATAIVLPVLAYYTFLFADIWFLPQGRIVKLLRDLATPLLFLAWTPTLLRVVARVDGPNQFAGVSLALPALMVATFALPFYYANYHDTQRYVRGMVLTYCLALVLELFAPQGYGPHAALFGFTFAYCLDRRPLHWYFTAAGAALYLALFWTFGRPFPAPIAAYLGLGFAVSPYLRLVKFSAHDGRRI